LVKECEDGFFFFIFPVPRGGMSVQGKRGKQKNPHPAIYRLFVDRFVPDPGSAELTNVFFLRDESDQLGDSWGRKGDADEIARLPAGHHQDVPWKHLV
jgi:hypothetical protein